MNPVTFQILGANSGFVDLNFNVSWNNLTPETQGLKNISITIDGFINSNGTNSLIAEVTVNQTSNSFRSRYKVRVISKNVGFNSGFVNFVVEKVDTKLFLSISTISVTHNPKAYNPNLRKTLGNPNLTGSLSHFNINGGLIANSVREPDNLQIINIAHYTFNTIKIKELPKVINIGLEYESFVEDKSSDYGNPNVVRKLFDSFVFNNYVDYPHPIEPGVSTAYFPNLNIEYSDSYDVSIFKDITTYYFKYQQYIIYTTSDEHDIYGLKNEIISIFSANRTPPPYNIENYIKIKIINTSLLNDNIILKIFDTNVNQEIWDSSKTIKHAILKRSTAENVFSAQNYSYETDFRRYDVVNYTDKINDLIFKVYDRTTNLLLDKFIFQFYAVNNYDFPEFDFKMINDFLTKQELLNYIKYGY